MERTPFDSRDENSNKSNSSSTKKVAHPPLFTSYTPDRPAPAPPAEAPTPPRGERVTFIPRPLEIYDLYDRAAESNENDDSEDDSESSSKSSKAKSRTTYAQQTEKHEEPYEAAPTHAVESKGHIFEDSEANERAYEGLPEPPSLEDLPSIAPFSEQAYDNARIEDVLRGERAPDETAELPEPPQGPAPDPNRFTSPLPPMQETTQSAPYIPPQPSVQRVHFNQPPPVPSVNPNQYTPTPTNTGGNLPPQSPNIPPPGGGNVSPYPGPNGQPMFNPNQYSGMGGVSSPNYNAAPVAPAVQTERVIERRPDIPARLAALYAIVRGHGRAKTQKQHGKRITALENQAQSRPQEAATSYGALGEQQRLRSEQQRQATEIRDLRARTTPEAGRPAGVAGVQEHGQRRPEAAAAATVAALAGEGTQTALAEQAAEQATRVQQDAWRRYEVDKHGHEIVSAPRGEAYLQERAQETGLGSTAYDNASGQRQAGNAGSMAAAAGAATAIGIASSSTPSSSVPPPYQQTYAGYDASGPSTLPSGMTAPALPAGEPTHLAPDHQLTSHAEPSSKPQSSSSVVFWLMLVIIIAAFFAAALI